MKYNTKYVYLENIKNDIYKLPENVQRDVETCYKNNNEIHEIDSLNEWMKMMKFRKGKIIRFVKSERVTLYNISLSNDDEINTNQSVNHSKQVKNNLYSSILLFTGVIFFLMGMTTLHDWAWFAIIFGIVLVIIVVYSAYQD